MRLADAIAAHVGSIALANVLTDQLGLVPVWPGLVVTAGTYAQLVEAAENCQVSIIHPGKPRNPNEPGLDDLIKRAEPFM